MTAALQRSNPLHLQLTPTPKSPQVRTMLLNNILITLDYRMIIDATCRSLIEIVSPDTIQKPCVIITGEKP
ncbi:hypothetical protein CDL15_Pgr000314 [Punica granatum]|uniref:Uncharacterized protein n=1 Tax=Punica granatum TaxID=22663 RepID=A0A218Y3G1_PUNGR|nr:hypothetical protein CDL15_Pgr000314 [Punica granatum]